jgi:hypothetical protein
LRGHGFTRRSELKTGFANSLYQGTTSQAAEKFNAAGVFGGTRLQARR